MKLARKIFDNFEGYVCAIMLAVMSIVVFMQVVCRYVLKSSLPWSEELSRYLQVYITFFGTAYGIKTGAHLGIEAFVDFLPATARKYVGLFVHICCVGVCLIILKLGIDVVMTQVASGQLSPSMRIPMWQIYIAIPIGMAFSCLRYVQLIVQDVKMLRNKDEEAEGTEVAKS